MPSNRSPWFWRAKDLGQVSDAEIADRVNRSVGTVADARARLGIASPGMRLKRETLEECIFKAINPYSPTRFKDLMYALENDYGSVNYRTVYRALKRMLMAGQIKRADEDGRRDWGYCQVKENHETDEV